MARVRPRAVIIGCGSVAAAHAYGFAASGAAAVVGLADIRREAVDALGDRCGVPAGGRFHDYRTMLDRTRPDIAVVCVWHALHLDAVLASIECGARLVVCEKPMAPSLGEAKQMAGAAAAAGTKLAISHQRRFYPGWARARALLAEGAIGAPVHARVDITDGLLNSGTHSIDMLRYIIGDPAARSVAAAVHRASDRYERGIRIEDSALAMIEFDGGFRAFVESDIAAGTRVSARASIVGTDGMLQVEENHVRILRGAAAGWQVVSGQPFGTEIATSPAPSALIAPLWKQLAYFGPTPVADFVRTFVDQAQSFAEWLDGEIDDHRNEARHGLATIEILMSIYESARTHEVTRLPLAEHAYPLDLMVEAGALPVTKRGRYDIRA
jgi:predicted dehydrogenase